MGFPSTDLLKVFFRNLALIMSPLKLTPQPLAQPTPSSTYLCWSIMLTAWTYDVAYKSANTCVNCFQSYLVLCCCVLWLLKYSIRKKKEYVCFEKQKIFFWTKMCFPLKAPVSFLWRMSDMEASSQMCGQITIFLCCFFKYTWRNSINDYKSLLFSNNLFAWR